MEKSQLARTILFEMSRVSKISADGEKRECATVPCNYQGNRECATVPCNYIGEGMIKKYPN